MRQRIDKRLAINTGRRPILSDSRPNSGFDRNIAMAKDASSNVITVADSPNVSITV
jgi:hypothetical protein